MRVATPSPRWRSAYRFGAPRSDLAGRALGRVIAPRLPDKHVDIEIYITLAGPLAHRRFAPRSKWLTSDLAIVEKMICGKGRSTPASKEKYAAHIVDQAEQIVDYFWTDIQVAAKALLKHETLTGDEISAAIRAARRKSRRKCRIGDPPAFALSVRTTRR
jgi:hypothetical protein